MNVETQPSSPLQEYRSAYSEQKSKNDHHVKRWRMVAFLRGGMFLGSIACLFLAAASVFGIAWGWLILSPILFLGFLGVAFYHELMEREIRVSGLLMSIFDQSVARIERNWEKVRAPACDPSPGFEPVSVDLDLFGEESLFALLGTVKTPNGISTLASWIEQPADPDEIQARQIAVAELKDQQKWRVEFALRCEQLAASQSGPNRFVSWAESEDWVPGRMWLLWLCRLTSIVSIASFVLLLTGLLPLTIAGPILLVAISINFLLSVVFAGAIHDIFNSISSQWWDHAPTGCRRGLESHSLCRSCLLY